MLTSPPLLGLLGVLVAWSPPGSYDTEHFRFRYVAAARDDAVALARQAEEIRARIVSALGRAPKAPTTVRVVATQQQFQRAQPGGRRFPDWVAGVAYPKQNLIVLGPAPPGGRRAARQVLFAHEYSHVALAHAVGFRRLPTWFVEGFADLQAMAPYLGDWRAWGGRGAQELETLHRGLGHDGRRASRSYRQSYDFVRFLRAQGDGVQFRRFIARLADGEGFDRALQRTYHLSPGELEREWKKSWNWRNVILPMLTSGLFLWVLAAFLLVLGFVRKRRERKAAIAAMDGGPDEAELSRREAERRAVRLREARARLGVLPGGLAEPDGEAEEGGHAAPREEGATGRDVGRGAEADFPPAPPYAGASADSSREPVEAREPVDARLRTEPPGPPPREQLPVLNVGLLMVSTVLVVTLTAIFASIWPHTRLWMLVAPAVPITLLGLRWAAR